MKARIKFQKYSVMKYVGHLDLMRYFQKAIRRSELPIKYSEGFNPHQIMSFASPLGVGITSDGEYIDIELTEKIDLTLGKERLNQAMVHGLYIDSIIYLSDDELNAMASVAAASYRVTLSKDISIAEEKITEYIQHFYQNPDCIIVTKKTKKGERELDLKPLIFEFYYHQNSFYLLLSSGSTDNIKPEFVMDKFFDSFHIQLPKNSMSIHRIDLFTRKNQKFVSLGEVGNDRS